MHTVKAAEKKNLKLYCIVSLCVWMSKQERKSVQTCNQNRANSRICMYMDGWRILVNWKLLLNYSTWIMECKNEIFCSCCCCCRHYAIVIIICVIFLFHISIYTASSLCFFFSLALFSFFIWWKCCVFVGWKFTCSN